jgi:hypothetical protein
MVLSPKGDDKFEVKSVPNDFDNNDQGFFGRYTSENISINKKCLLQLIDLGYDMMSWLEGKPLKLNCKCVGNQSKR